MTDLVVETPPDILAGNGKTDGLECPDCDFVAKPGAMSKAWLAGHRRSKHGVITSKPKKAPAAKKERAPKVATAPAPRTSRRSAAKLLTPIWNVFAGMVPGRAGGVMAWEAPAAGPVLDKALAGTFVDRLVLQRIAKEEDKWGDVFSLMVLPGIGMMVDSGAFASAPPPVQAAVMSAAESAIVDMLGATLAAEVDRKRKLDQLGEKARAAGLEGLEQAVQGMMANLFGPAPSPAPAPEPVAV